MNTTETRLQQQITHLRARLLVMAAAVGIALDEARASLSAYDKGRALAVVEGDAAINALENEIDAIALSILARNQPVAQDLRFVVAALRMVGDLERIGDEAATIAERVLLLEQPLPPQVLGAVDELGSLATRLYTRAVEAFREADAQAALALCRSDDESTQQEVRALHQMMDCFGHEDTLQPCRSGVGMHGILMARSLNRICRRAANMAEQTYFIVKGVNIKHLAVE